MRKVATWDYIYRRDGYGGWWEGERVKQKRGKPEAAQKHHVNQIGPTSMFLYD